MTNQQQTQTKQDVFGAVRIGNGEKLHSAYVDGKYGLFISCGCAGTRSGSAYSKAKFFANKAANCKN